MAIFGALWTSEITVDMCTKCKEKRLLQATYLCHISRPQGCPVTSGSNFRSLPSN